MSTNEIIKLAYFSEAVRESTLKRLTTVDQDHINWRPADGMMSFADIANHLLETDEWLFKKVMEKNVLPIKGKANSITVSSEDDYFKLLVDLKDSGLKRKEFIKTLTADQIDEQIFDSRFDSDATVWWLIVRGNLDHEIHHRGQVSTYLRLAGTV